MTTPLDPATLRALAADLDEEAQLEAQHALHCACRNNVMHAARVGLLDDLAHRYRTRAIKVEQAAATEGAPS